MSFKLISYSVAFAMSLTSVALFIILLLLSTVQTNVHKDSGSVPVSSMYNFKEHISKIIRKQSSIIQILLDKIQTKAHNVLVKLKHAEDINTMRVNAFSKHDGRDHILDAKRNKAEEHQIESPMKVFRKDGTSEVVTKPRSFNSLYTSTGFGVSGNSNYGPLTYHHHSIGFDPINIVVSVSILSFLLQALQGLLARARLSNAMVEARSYDLKKDSTVNRERKGLKSLRHLK